ncbi:MAG: exodeoxyribonuclease VII small subunit [Burkholderiaceae bacterium]|nr:exodeoxyribonuclease VII small subunit [Burkholderiaceae bacterium]
MVKKAATAGAVEQASALSYEQAVEELEQLVAKMEGGTLALEESLAAYKRGAELVAHCRKVLADVQQQVSVLEGELLKPFDARGARGAGSGQGDGDDGGDDGDDDDDDDDNGGDDDAAR